MKLSTLLLLLLLAAAALQAQPSKPEVVSDGLPASMIGTILREWFAAVNSGDRGQIKKFVDSRFGANAFRYQQSAGQYADLFDKLYAQSGGLDIVTVYPQQPPQPIVVLAKSKRGDRYVRVLAGLDGSESGKLFGMGIERTQAPEAEKLSAMTQRMSEIEMLTAINRHLEKLAASGDLSGVVLIAKDDEVLIERAFGLADREAKIPNTLDTKFGLASVGKMFTATAIAQLVKAGKLSFDDTVEEVLPDYPNKDVASRVTVKQLLTHSAGMGTFFESPGFVKGKQYATPTAEIEVYKDEKLAFEPGTRWRYSNAGYSLLGAIIERLSGKTYIDYIRDNIFKPLGMRDTYTNSPGKAAPKSSVYYTQSDTDPLGLEPYTPDRKIANGIPSSFGGCCSTAGDIFRFLRAYRTGKLLGEQMTQAMVSYNVNTNPKGRQRNAFGIFETDSNGEIVRGHSGGSRVDVQMLWNSGYTVIVMTNQFPPVANTISGDIVGLITKQIALHK